MLCPCFCSLHKFADREIEDFGNVEFLIVKLKGGLGVTFAFTLRTGYEKVREKLHLDFFETISHAALAATLT